MADWTPERDAELVERIKRWGHYDGDSDEADLRDLRAAWLAAVEERDAAQQQLAEGGPVLATPDEQLDRLMVAMQERDAARTEVERLRVERDEAQAEARAQADRANTNLRVSEGAIARLAELEQELGTLRALLAEPSEEEAKRLGHLVRSAIKFDPFIPYGRSVVIVRAILADLRARAEVDDGE